MLTLAAKEGVGGQECPPYKTPLRILDVGTGSVCIALALAKEFLNAEIYATDVSAAALEVARANAARHQLEKRIHFHQADLLEGLNLTDLDFVVSNPPYVGESEEDQVQMEVSKFEPRNAVFAGPAGFEVIERLLPQAHAALRSGDGSSWKSVAPSRIRSCGSSMLATTKLGAMMSGRTLASSPICNPSSRHASPKAAT
jgi:methylase of polypeptide subunit release factors